MSSNTSSNTSTTSTTLPVVKQERKANDWQIFTQRAIGLLKTVHKDQNAGDGLKFCSWLKEQRKDYKNFTDQEIIENVSVWLLTPRIEKPKVIKARKTKEPVLEEKNTVISVSSSSSVVSVASSKKPKAKPQAELKQQDKRVEDIQNILTAVRALKNISPSLALETAITSLQAFIDAH